MGDLQVTPIMYGTPSPWGMLPVPGVDLLVLEASKGKNPAYIEEVKKQWGSRWKGFLQAYTDGALEPQTGKGYPRIKGGQKLWSERSLYCRTSGHPGVDENGLSMNKKWVPAHVCIEVNEGADRAAKLSQ